MNTKFHILLIDDDKKFSSFLSTSLTKNGYRVTAAYTGMGGLSLAASICPDVILLDLGLPDLDGCEVIKQLRCWCSVPIIVISARVMEQDKVTALDMGADDYITKPFGTAELMARIRTSLRRNHSGIPNKVYRAAGLEINFEKRMTYIDGEDIHLTQIEYQLLSLLAENSGRVLTYEFIMSTIWGPYMDGNNQILRVNMSNIRRKIEKNPARPQYVFTEVGIGYRMRENENA